VCAVVIASISCLAFVVGNSCKERNTRIFRLLNHLGAGVSLGMALIALPNDAQLSFGTNNNYLFNALITGFSFIAMIVIENLSAVMGQHHRVRVGDAEGGGGLCSCCLSAHSYEAVSVQEDADLMGDVDDTDLSGEVYDNEEEDYAGRDDDEVAVRVGGGDIEMPVRNRQSPIKQAHRQQQFEERRLRPESEQQLQQQNEARTYDQFHKRRFFPTAVLVVVSVYEALYGGNLAMAEHTGYGGFGLIVIHTLLLSFTFGLMLGFLLAPKKFFLVFMAVFSLSASTGIIICSLVPDAYREDVAYFRGYAAIVAAGVFLYLSTIHMLPAELLYDTSAFLKSQADEDTMSPQSEDDDEESSADINIWNDRGKSLTSRILYLVMKVAALVTGFVLTVLPTIMLQMDVFIRLRVPRAPVPSPH
jgi:hypothetical protein